MKCFPLKKQLGHREVKREMMASWILFTSFSWLAYLICMWETVAKDHTLRTWTLLLLFSVVHAPPSHPASVQQNHFKCINYFMVETLLSASSV